MGRADRRHPTRGDFGLAYQGGSLFAIGEEIPREVGLFGLVDLVDSLGRRWPGGSWASAPPVCRHPTASHRRVHLDKSRRIWSQGYGQTSLFLPDHLYRAQAVCGTPTNAPPAGTATRTATQPAGGTPHQRAWQGPSHGAQAFHGHRTA